MTLSEYGTSLELSSTMAARKKQQKQKVKGKWFGKNRVWCDWKTTVKANISRPSRQQV